ncbi:hypothetical protein [Enterococcus plantarum]|nr:hypothetical protein [Enterococcus plantarum]
MDILNVITLLLALYGAFKIVPVFEIIYHRLKTVAEKYDTK